MKILSAIVCQSIAPGLLIGALMLMPFMTGCGASDLVSAIDNAEQLVPQIAQLATGITQLIAPEYAPLIQPFANLVAQDGRLLEQLIADYKAAPTDSTLKKINAAIQDGLKNVQAIVAAVGIKNAESAGYANTFAGLVGVIFNEIALIASKAGPKVSAQLPAVFGWSISGVMLLAIDGKPLPAPTVDHVKSSGYKAKDIAAQWNKLCGKNEQAKIHEPRKRVFKVPVPGTGRK